MNPKITYCLLLGGLLSSCYSTSDTRRACNKQEANKLRIQVINNYLRNKEAFQSLHQLFRFPHVRYISLKDGAISAIDYKIESNDKEQWCKVEIAPEVAVTDSILVRDGFTKSYLAALLNKLNKINASSIRILDNYDRFRGEAFKEIEISYNDVTCTTKYRYRIFDKSLKTINKSFIEFSDNASGANVLDDNTFYYYTYR